MDFDLDQHVIYRHENPAVGNSTHSHGDNIRGNIKIFYTVVIDHGSLVGDGNIDADHINSGTAADGDVLTADGAGGSQFEAPAGVGGDAGHSPRFDSGTAFPTTPTPEDNDVFIFNADVASGLDWKDTNGTTDLTSATAGDMARYNATDWVKVINVVGGSVGGGIVANYWTHHRLHPQASFLHSVDQTTEDLPTDNVFVAERDAQPRGQPHRDSSGRAAPRQRLDRGRRGSPVLPRAR